jgi:hypothetical protein
MDLQVTTPSNTVTVPAQILGLPSQGLAAQRPLRAKGFGGGRGIRTPGGSDTTAVFKFVDGAFGVARGRLSCIQVSRPNTEFVCRSSPLTAPQGVG